MDPAVWRWQRRWSRWWPARADRPDSCLHRSRNPPKEFQPKRMPNPQSRARRISYFPCLRIESEGSGCRLVLLVDVHPGFFTRGAIGGRRGIFLGLGVIIVVVTAVVIVAFVLGHV